MPDALQESVWTARAVLARVLSGEAARLEMIPAGMLPPALGAVWSATADGIEDGLAGDALLRHVLTRSGVEAAFVGALIGDEHAGLIRSAPSGVARLVEICSRHEAARFAERLPEEIASGDGVRAAQRVVELLRQSQPHADKPTPADLRDWRKAPAAQFYAGGFVQPGSVTLLSARGGGGKSLLTLSLWLRLGRGAGGDWLGALPLAPLPLRVLLVEAECGEARIERRIREMVMGGELSADDVDAALENLIALTAERLTRRGRLLEWLPDLVREHDADVVAIDPIRCLLPEDLESENDNLAFGRIVDDLVGLALRAGVAVVVVDHDSKDGRVGRGASSKQDAAAFVGHLTAPDETDPDYRELRLGKQRDPGAASAVAFAVRRGAPVDDGSGGTLFPVRFDPADLRPTLNTITTPTGASRRAVSAQDVTDADLRVIAAVKTLFKETSRGVTVRAVSERAGLGKSAAAESLARLVRLKLVHRPEDRGPVYPPSEAP